MLKIKRVLLFSAMLMLFSCRIFAQPASLQYSGFINDYTGTLKEEEKQALENLVRSIEKETTAEIAAALVENLAGDSIENYASELFNTWAIGKKEKDNGVLILVSLQEKKIRIEVGYGLEPVLPDGLCGRIIRDAITPEFKKGNYYEGLTFGINEILKAVKGEPLPSAPSKDAEQPGLIFFFVFWHIFLAFFSFGLFRKTGIALYLSVLLISGLLALAAGKNISFPQVMALLIMAPFLFVFLMGMLAPIIFAVTAWKLKKKYKGRWKKHLPDYMKESMVYSGSSGGFRGGGGGSFGGGFGGGSSGGGGASGGW
ncbi:MAG TPA: TPM domain-containing protein [bacterium]|nr:TPM domain-containing protein [bacterium]